MCTLKGEFKVIKVGYGCESNAWEKNSVYGCGEGEQVSMKEIRYGMDVIGEIGDLGLKEDKSG
ncbi:hypothetical protein [Siminovitchia fortis]|uniref:hypothetical protein n=1 Tax=Siminovitchia fortis TaxID=254758 RepID=UPI00119DEC9A|nr:hypothetical protein [Siminovitchia fortis]